MRKLIHKFPQFVWFVVVLSRLLYGNNFERALIMAAVIVHMALASRLSSHASLAG